MNRVSSEKPRTKGRQFLEPIVTSQLREESIVQTEESRFSMDPRTNRILESQHLLENHNTKVSNSRVSTNNRRFSVQDCNEKFNYLSYENYKIYRKLVWKQNWIYITYLVIKFIKKMKMINKYKYINNDIDLQYQNYLMINDQSSYFENEQIVRKQLIQFKDMQKIPGINHSSLMRDKSYSKHIAEMTKNLQTIQEQNHKKKLGQKLFKYIEDVDKYMIILSLDNSYLLIWDFFVMISQIYALLYAPFHIGFMIQYQNVEHYYQVAIMLYSISLIFYILDIIMTLNTSYYEKGMEIKTRKEIFKNYIDKYLAVDIVLIISQVTIIFSKLDYLFLIDFLRLIKISRLINRFSYFFNTSENKNGVFQIVMIFVRVIYLSHTMGCINHYVCSWQISNNVPNNWVESHDLLNSTIFERYVHTLYYMIMTCITAGVLSSSTYQDQLMFIFNCLILANGFAYLVNSLGSIMGEMQISETILRKKMREINHYLDKRNISKDLTNRIKRHYEYLHQDEYEGYQKGQFIVQDLSENIFKQLQVETYYKRLTSLPIFKNYFSQEFLQELCCLFQEVSIAPDQSIYQTQQLNDSLYFLINGQMKLYVGNENRDTQIRTINQDQFFNQFRFFTSTQKVQEGARSIGPCHLAYIERHRFIELCKNYSQDYQKFCFLRDNLFQNPQSYKMLQIQCASCKRYTHQTQDCHLITYNRDKFNFLYYNVFGFRKSRKFFQRRQQKSMNSRSQKLKCQEGLQKVLEKNFYFKFNQNISQDNKYETKQKNCSSIGKRRSFNRSEKLKDVRFIDQKGKNDQIKLPQYKKMGSLDGLASQKSPNSIQRNILFNQIKDSRRVSLQMNNDFFNSKEIYSPLKKVIGKFELQEINESKSSMSELDNGSSKRSSEQLIEKLEDIEQEVVDQNKQGPMQINIIEPENIQNTGGSKDTQQNEIINQALLTRKVTNNLQVDEKRSQRSSYVSFQDHKDNAQNIRISNLNNSQSIKKLDSNRKISVNKQQSLNDYNEQSLNSNPYYSQNKQMIRDKQQIDIIEYQNQNKNEIAYDVYQQYQYYYPEYNLEKVLKAYKSKKEQNSRKSEFRKRQTRFRSNSVIFKKQQKIIQNNQLSQVKTNRKTIILQNRLNQNTKKTINDEKEQISQQERSIKARNIFKLQQVVRRIINGINKKKQQMNQIRTNRLKQQKTVNRRSKSVDHSDQQKWFQYLCQGNRLEDLDYYNIALTLNHFQRTFNSQQEL